jgi:hypothetical protein
MKFPQNTFITNQDPIYQKYCNAAIDMAVEYGILIETKKEWNDEEKIQYLYFEVDGHRFGCLRDLRRALENKSFL